VRRYLAYTWDLRRPQPEPPWSPGVRVTILAPANVEALGQLDVRMTPQEIERRWGEDQECLLAWMGDDLAHYRWQGMRPAYMPYLGRILRPLDGDQLVLDVYTRPDLRGRGVASITSSVGRDRGRAAGCTRAVWLIAWWNVPALRIADDAPWCRLAGSVGLRRGPLHRGTLFTTGCVQVECDGSLTVGAIQP
jgi:GNAT superfamily N-acetyltransferase